MSTSVVDNVSAYLRELSTHRAFYFGTFVVIAVSSIIVALLWPKNYTSSSTIYADNSNILQPLMEGNAVPTGISDQAQMAQEILFKREFENEVLDAGGWEYDDLRPADRNNLIKNIQNRARIESVGRSPANLIRISFTDADPVRAFAIAQKYTSIFIEQSVVEKREESRNAFEFIQNQVTSYHEKLQLSEEKLSNFKSENNLGTLADANARISRYRAEIERLELELIQLQTEEESVEGQLAGQQAISKDLSELNAVRNRINALQVQLDSLRSRYFDSYPDVILLKEQIADLMAMYDSGQTSLLPLESDDLDKEGVTPLHQQLRSQLSSIRTAIQSRTSQLNGIKDLLVVESDRIRKINAVEAELAELTRDYNVTRDFYNDMLKRLENARVSMNLDEQQQGVTFKVQESAIIPTSPDGLAFTHLLAASLILSICAPLGLLVLYMELDPRIRSEANWAEEWPPMIMSVSTMNYAKSNGLSDKWFAAIVLATSLSLYGTAAGVKLAGLI